MFKRICKGLMLLSLYAPVSAMSSSVYLSGTTVDFYYDNGQPGMLSYGSLDAIGDSIIATPSGFLAESLNGGSVSFSAFGTVTIVAKSGYRLDTIQVAQQGDYKLSGANASVDAVAGLTVVNNTQSVADITSVLTNSSVFDINDGALHQWSASSIIDFNALSWQSATSINLSLDSALYANTTGLGDLAFIQNKFVGGGFVTVVTTPVPVPAAIWLFGSGLFALAGLSRKRKIV